MASAESTYRTSRRRRGLLFRACGQARRAGFSLLETMLATAVLLASIVALSQLASVGRRHAERAERMTQAQIVCENLLTEISVGLRKPEVIKDSAVPTEPGWFYSIKVEKTAWENLVSVEVSVREQKDPSGENGANSSTSDRYQRDKRPTYRLVRWLPSRPPPKSSYSSQDEDEDDGDDGRVRSGGFGGGG